MTGFLPEREGKRLHAGSEELDLEPSIDNTNV
jgi:hypothetical protein